MPTPDRPEVQISPAESFAEFAALRIGDALDERLASQPRCRMALAGGSTPAPVYRRLANRDLAWERVDLFFGDERLVPSDDPRSNYRMAAETLGDVWGRASVHRIEGELVPEAAIEHYSRVLGEDRLDIVLLGMGDDGHTASLFPSPDADWDTPARVVATQSPRPPAERISLSLASLNEAWVVFLLIAGVGKASRLAEVYQQILTRSPRLPAARIQPSDGQLVWLVDSDAASELPVELA